MVESTPYSNDEGRDLIVHHSDGDIVVECKHYPGRTVGREVVQKLHSAVITYGARRGMIITTGRMAPTAKLYSDKLREDIQFVDATTLSVMAQSVGLDTGGGSQDHQAMAVPTTPERLFQGVFLRSVLAPQRYVPSGGKYPAATIERRTQYVPFFQATYQAEGKVKTAVGDQQASWSGKAWLSSDGNQLQSTAPSAALANAQTLASLKSTLQATPGAAPTPQIHHVDAKKHLQRHLLNGLSESVTYTGRNNVTYTKHIKPSASTLQIDNTNLIYIPKQEIKMAISGQNYHGNVEELDNKFVLQAGQFSSCTVCSKHTSPSTQIWCATCHRPAHRARLFLPHSGNCGSCNATICRNHIYRKGGVDYCELCKPPECKKRLNEWLPVGLISGLGSVSVVLTDMAVAGNQMALSFIGLALVNAPLFFKSSSGNDLSSKKLLEYPKQ